MLYDNIIAYSNEFKNLMNREDNISLSRVHDPVNDLPEKKKGVTLSSAVPIPTDTLRSVMESITPSHLSESDTKVWTSHVETLVAAYEEYVEVVCSGKVYKSKVDNYIQRFQHFHKRLVYTIILGSNSLIPK